MRNAGQTAPPQSLHATTPGGGAGFTTNPGASCMAQVARTRTDPVDGFLRRHRFVICDRDAKFTTQFRGILPVAGVEVIRPPQQAPNCNTHGGRFVLSIKSECLNRLMFFGEASLRRAIAACLRHYHQERPHQRRGNETLVPAPRLLVGEGRCTERPGGLLKHDYRAA